MQLVLLCWSAKETFFVKEAHPECSLLRSFPLYFAVGLRIIHLRGWQRWKDCKKSEKDVCSENELKLHTNKRRSL